MPNWGIAASPVVERRLDHCRRSAAQDACVAACDKRTGEERWKALADVASYSRTDRDRPGGTTRVDLPDRGTDRGPRSRLSADCTGPTMFKWEQWPIAHRHARCCTRICCCSPTRHKGTILLRLGRDKSESRQVWHRRESDAPDGKALHCLISTPQIRRPSHLRGRRPGVLEVPAICRPAIKSGRTGRWSPRTAGPPFIWCATATGPGCSTNEGS